MQVFTYSEARQKLAEVLKIAEVSGKVIIRRKDGLSFSLMPEEMPASPMDVASIKTDITSDELVDIVRKGRRRKS